MLTPVELHRKFPTKLIPERWKESLMRREAENARKSAQKSALRLAEILLTYPQCWAMQQAPSMSLPDGRKMNVRLINTGEFDSLDKLLRAKRGADRIEVSIRPEKDNQYGYSVSWHISRPPQIGDYREYLLKAQLSAVFDSRIAPEGHAAYVGKIEVNFDPTRQCRVYTRCKEIFDIAIASLPRQQSCARLP